MSGLYEKVCLLEEETKIKKKARGRPKATSRDRTQALADLQVTLWQDAKTKVVTHLNACFK
eukprot:9550797-Prorocentrum_lima.AAC.1